MGKAFRFYGQDMVPGEGDTFIPGLCGRGDMAFNRQTSCSPTNPLYGSAFGGAYMSIGSSGQIIFNDNAGFAPTYTKLDSDYHYWLDSSRFDDTDPMETWSASFEYHLGEDVLVNAPAQVIEFISGEDMVFGLALRPFPNTFPIPDTARQLRVYGTSGYSSSYTTYQIAVGWTYRFEIQVQPTSPKVTIRAYLRDFEPETAVVTLTADPPITASTGIRLGDLMPGSYNKPYTVGKIDVWDTYDADGQMPVVIPVDNRRQVEWYEWRDSHLEPCEVVGTWDEATQTINRADTTFHEYDTRVVSHKPFTSTTVAYSSWSRFMDIHTPDEPPPPGGYVTYVYWHGGFFVSGGRNQLSADLLHHLINRNIRVVSADYILSQVSPGAYPAWPTAARHPEHIIDGKLAVRWIVDNLPDSNPERIIVGGFSAGSIIGNAVAASVGMDDDGTGRDLRLSGAIGATRGGAGLGDDIMPWGVFTYASLTNLEIARARDLSHPSFGVLNQGRGTLHITMATYMGMTLLGNATLTGTSISEMWAVQRAEGRDIPPYAMTHGSSDYLLDHAQAFDLIEAGETHNVPVTTFYAPGIIHEYTDKLFDINDWDVWYETLPGV